MIRVYKKEVDTDSTLMPVKRHDKHVSCLFQIVFRRLFETGRCEFELVLQ
jgi:hypothetical protein